MEVLKRKNEIEVIEDSKRTKKNEDSSDSEDEDDLLYMKYYCCNECEIAFSQKHICIVIRKGFT